MDASRWFGARTHVREAFERCKQALADTVTLAHSKHAVEVQNHRDASRILNLVYVLIYGIYST